MTKKDFVEKISEKTNITKKEAAEFTDAFLNTLTEAFAESDGVNFIGFGKFEVRNRAERKGKNPKTGEVILIPAYKAPVFTPSKSLKEIANK